MINVGFSGECFCDSSSCFRTRISQPGRTSGPVNCNMCLSGAAYTGVATPVVMTVAAQRKSRRELRVALRQERIEQAELAP